jgi:hypothetical protein
MGCKSYMNPQSAIRLSRERAYSWYSSSLICETDLRIGLLWIGHDDLGSVQRSNGQCPLEIEKLQGILGITPDCMIGTGCDVGPRVQVPMITTKLRHSITLADQDASIALDDLDCDGSE